jgi:hypothetical protein
VEDHVPVKEVLGELMRDLKQTKEVMEICAPQIRKPTARREPFPEKTFTLANNLSALARALNGVEDIDEDVEDIDEIREIASEVPEVADHISRFLSQWHDSPEIGEVRMDIDPAEVQDLVAEFTDVSKQVQSQSQSTSQDQSQSQ